MGKQQFGHGYVELTRIIMAKSMGIPPDDIDMLAIFSCVQRSIEEKVEKNMGEYILTITNEREDNAIIKSVGNIIVPMIFDGEYPFGDFVRKYEKWYEDNIAAQFLKMKIQSIREEREE